MFVPYRAYNATLMAHPAVNIGERYGRLVVIARVGKDRHLNYRYLCQCDCGAEKVVNSNSLRTGRTISCGCKRREGTHQQTNTRIYHTWESMKQRCLNPNIPTWRYYGGRGITICDRWLDFSQFLADMGDRPEGTSLDRIDPDGNYEPGNCRWATMLEQTANKRPHGKTTHCAKGHEFTPENTYIDKRGDRSCQTCRRASSARAVARRPRPVCIRCGALKRPGHGRRYCDACRAARGLT